MSRAVESVVLEPGSSTHLPAAGFLIVLPATVHCWFESLALQAARVTWLPLALGLSSRQPPLADLTVPSVSMVHHCELELLHV